ncbi:DegT/DnrJ/EryC1/StrS family aminotransferase [Halobacteriovorax sp. XZX-3]|uniref:DegT/DnrJ/EryC1/StrS family aminotransferase n=1 Tax=unclassified Halobacteriovorax TaxID=2639665 RepID=UPI0037225F45
MKIPLFRPYSSSSLPMEIKRVIESGHWTGGREVSEVENILAETFNFPNFTCTSSATSAFEILIDTFYPDSKVNIVVPVNTFAATAEVPRRLGHKVIFCDVDVKTGMIDIASLKLILNSHKVDCVIPVSIGGHLYDREKLKELKQSYGFDIIEDLAQLIYKDCFDHFVDAAFFSFYPNKILSSPDGGGFVLSDESKLEDLRKVRLHGIKRISPIEYDIECLGRKANMTDLSAVILKDQIYALDEKIKRRQSRVVRYQNLLKDIPQISCLYHSENIISSLFVIHAENRKELQIHLADNGVQTSIHFKPLHLHSYWKKDELVFSGAESYYSTSLSLPFYETLEDNEISYIVELIAKFYSN